MRTIKELSDNIKDEIEDAHKYASRALDLKDSDRETADLYCSLAQEELKHMEMLHARVVKCIDDYRKNNGEPPIEMRVRYETLHEIHTSDARKVRLMIQLYKDKEGTK